MSRPALKLRLSTSHNSSQALPLDTPSIASTPKIKLKFGSSAPKPAAPYAVDEIPTGPVKKEKKPKKPKKDKAETNGTPSSTKSKKRIKGDEDEDEEATIEVPKPKKLKLTNRTPITPIIRLKGKGKVPQRALGSGYDSEASDREADPAIEEQFILRMAPGDDCDYLRRAIEEKKIGVPLREGGADVRMKFLNKDGRRAVVTIRQRHYAATMVDLPCVVEGMKSWDKRGWWKSADICQMLLVIGLVPNEQAAHDVPLPPQIDSKTFQYPHGLTPPMHHVRKRRFRKRISNKTIEAVEEEVERLLQADLDCMPGTSEYTLDDNEGQERETSMSQSEGDGAGYALEGSYYGDQDAEGEMDGEAYLEEVDAEEGEGLEADLEMAMMEAEGNDDLPAADRAAAVGTAEVALNGFAPTPASVATGDSAEESSDADDEDGADEIDEDLLERQQDLLRQKEEIADLEAAIQSQTTELEKLTNPILRQKLVKKIQSLRSDLELKRGAVGEEGDE
ncbi:MAG: hypothetical protein M1827_007068 [Pycnora praestabilis]|nr:MAG: hypothetical protein M1827_007068 [Pycnora praestabilis]